MTLAAPAATDIAAHAAAHGHDDATPSLGALLLVLALIAAWVGATVVWGFDGFIGAADVAVALAFAYILTLTRQ